MEICEENKQHLVAHGFNTFVSKHLGSRFTQQANFIANTEEIVPPFYGEVGSHLSFWKKPAPKVRLRKPTADDVSTEAIAEDAEDYEG